MHKIYILDNPVQEYEWGSKTAIPRILGIPNNEDKPKAELWMGAHPKAPSRAKINDDTVPLNKLIESDPAGFLGENTAKRFSKRLPFLFKILSAAKPLSIQAHPNKSQAEEGFARENQIGIPLDAYERNYRDDNHKPEIICALTPFWALNGFRKPIEALKLIQRVSDASISYELSAFKQEVNMRGLRNFLHQLMRFDKDRLKTVLDNSLKIAMKLRHSNIEYDWMLKLHEQYPYDAGIYAPLYLNLVKLEPGDALYLDAGDLHAYLDGVGMELMANSDNVLRGGLTPKHIDIKELFKIVNFKQKEVVILRSKIVSQSQSIFETPAEEFLLSRIRITSNSSHFSIRNRSSEILFCLDGLCEIIDSNGDHTHINKGISFFIPASIEQYRIEGNAILYKASVPIANQFD